MLQHNDEISGNGSQPTRKLQCHDAVFRGKQSLSLALKGVGAASKKHTSSTRD